MPKLIAFTSITLDGYFAGKDGDIGWAHRDVRDKEWSDFVAGNASGGGVLVFGRITYQMMASFWPTPMAAQNEPVVAKQMNALQKVVFSRTLDEATWSNTKLVKGDLAAEMRKLKQAAGKDMAILGSGSIVSQLAQAGLIDEFQFVVIPIAIGQGRTVFDGISAKLPMKLMSSRTFKNGNVLLCYTPAG